jgi:(E)-4-hydroxy-3-methylbut-2-enyl-diphosphate synthase
MYNRNNTKKIKVGNLYLGGNDKIYIQSMTNTKTKDIDSTVNQINELEKAGCEIIRCCVLDMEDAYALGEIKKHINIPLVADIHFDYRLALEAINQGVDKIRLNPGNLRNKDEIIQVVNACKDKQIPIRIGVNSGSLPKGLEHSAEAFVMAAKYHVDILEELDFYDIVISMKASDINLCVEAYELASKTFPYPLHIGITEAGTIYSGTIKSAIGIGILLHKKIGNTIRVSLTDDPINEIYAAKEILKNLGLIKGPKLVSCPTCGRTQYDMIPIAKEIEKYLSSINKDITVAVMGCAVNGPGEAKHADIGIAGGKGEAILFKKGEIIKKIKEDKIIETLIEEINKI